MDEEFSTYSIREARFVCAECVNDSYLANAIRAALDDEACSYCNSAPAANITVLLDEIEDAIMFSYTDPANELPYDGREGGYQGEVLLGCEVVDALDDWTDHDDLRQDVADAFAGSEWCERDYFGLDKYQSLQFGWERFCDQVKHRTRYLFLQELKNEDGDYDPGNIPPGKMLDALGALFCEYELFRTLPVDSVLVRARVVGVGERPATAAELGTAPREKARLPNRMSPAGIPMFYGAFDEEAAVIETYEARASGTAEIALARFRSRKALQVLDLTALPDMPSDFDSENRGDRHAIRFLRSFERDLTARVERDDRVHTEYIPTQVVTEFVRHRLGGPSGSVEGIVYRSSRDPQRKRVAIVLFADDRDCGPRDRGWADPEPFLELSAVRYADPKEFAKLWAP